MIQLFQTAKFPNSNVCFLAVGGLLGLHPFGKSFPPSFGVGLQCLVQCRPPLLGDFQLSPPGLILVTSADIATLVAVIFLAVDLILLSGIDPCSMGRIVLLRALLQLPLFSSAYAQPAESLIEGQLNIGKVRRIGFQLWLRCRKVRLHRNGRLLYFISPQLIQIKLHDPFLLVRIVPAGLFSAQRVQEQFSLLRGFLEVRLLLQRG